MSHRFWPYVIGIAFTCAVPVRASGTFPPHQGESPWSFTTVAEPSSRFVVNDTDSSTIDVYLLRSQGPIVIDVPIRRYLGPTDATGHLLNLAALHAHGVVGETATITVPAYDVDETTAPNTDCDSDGVVDTLVSEVDELYLNDQKIGTLTGRNNSWARNVFMIPTGLLRFPSQPGQTAVNRFRVEIDTGNRNVRLSSGSVGCDRWAVTIDWIGVKFDAISPVVLVHGIRSAGLEIFGDFRAGLESQHIWAIDDSVILPSQPSHGILPSGCGSSYYNDSIAFNLEQLRSQIPRIAEHFGSETLHFVAHSKGGLDTLGFLSSTLSRPIGVSVGMMGDRPVIQPLEGRSLVTLSTPYEGSVLAEYGVEARQLGWTDAIRVGREAFYAKFLEGDYYCDLTPDRARAFMASIVMPSTVHWASVAVDADCNGDHHVTDRVTCRSGQAETQGFSAGSSVADLLYRFVGTVSAVTIVVRPVPFGLDATTVHVTPTFEFLENDVLVTQASASRSARYPITGWHHTNVHSRENGLTIASDAQDEGLVSWRFR